MSSATEQYVYWSHFNFTASQWREAAKRFLELQVALNVAAAKDAEIDHDQVAAAKDAEIDHDQVAAAKDAEIDHDQDFFDCDVCRELSDLQEHYSEFARAFANLWAMRALKGEPK